ncbi:MAG: hypothetical protein KBD00_02050 [Candidatus Peribacteraceae bacterium]|nr:hypothetical protein [Candidatus Peribacteraceae bacterium]
MNTNKLFEQQPLASLEDQPIVDSRDARARNVRKISGNIQKILGYDPTKHTRQQVIEGELFTGDGLLHLHSTKEGGINIADELMSEATDLEVALDEYPHQGEIPKYLRYVSEARQAAHDILNAPVEANHKERSMGSFGGPSKKRRHA